MSQSAIRTEFDRNMAIKRFQSANLPCTMTIKKGAPRSNDQNRLQRKWMLELEDQGDMTSEEYRGFCKLYFGVAIAKECEIFAEEYDENIKNLPYETKMKLMMEPFDLPITRKFSTGQKTRYLDKIYSYWTGKGFQLTMPEDRKDAA